MLNWFFFNWHYINLFKKNFLVDFFYKNLCFKFLFYFSNLTVLFFGEKFLIEYQTKFIFIYFFNTLTQYNWALFSKSLNFFNLFFFFNLFIFFILYKLFYNSIKWIFTIIKSIK